MVHSSHGHIYKKLRSCTHTREKPIETHADTSVLAHCTHCSTHARPYARVCAQCTMVRMHVPMLSADGRGRGAGGGGPNRLLIGRRIRDACGDLGGHCPAVDRRLVVSGGRNPAISSPPPATPAIVSRPSRVCR